jgi:hypothetical protein
MLNLPIGKFLKSYGHLNAFSQAIQSVPVVPDGGMALNDRNFQELLNFASDFLHSCGDIGLSVTKSAAVMLLDELKRIEPVDGNYRLGGEVLVRVSAALRGVQSCLQHESALKVALILPPDKEELFDPKSPLFGIEVHAKFTRAIYEIDEASKCLALGRSTASVFHLMRILEIALRAIHTCLGISVALIGNDRNWGKILGRIRDENLRRGNCVEKDYFKDIYARLDAIKDAWRNTTMHVETIYTEQEARILFDNTRSFMQKISSRMDENGLPLA